MEQMDILEMYLKFYRYKYERVPRKRIGEQLMVSGKQLILYDSGEQLIVYGDSGDPPWNVYYDDFSDGHEDGLLEGYGEFFGTARDHREGWLTAEDVICRLAGLGFTRRRIKLNKKNKQDG